MAYLGMLEQKGVWNRVLFTLQGVSIWELVSVPLCEPQWSGGGENDGRKMRRQARFLHPDTHRKVDLPRGCEGVGIHDLRLRGDMLVLRRHERDRTPDGESSMIRRWKATNEGIVI